jgi:hypothetical protein
MFLMNKRSRALTICLSLGLSATAASSCDGGIKETVVQEALVGASTTPFRPRQHLMGSIRVPEATMQAHALPSRVVPLAFPASADLSPYLPQPGNQLSENSCVGWAVAYSAKTLEDAFQNRWLPDDITHEFSPSWIYNQINGGKNGGTDITVALNLVVSSGVDTMSSFPYVDGDFLTQPGTTSNARAGHFKAASWGTTSVSLSIFKSWLASGTPILVTFNVLPDFDALNGTTNTVYDTDAGTVPGGTKPCDTTCTSTCTGPGLCGTCNPSTNVCTIPTCSSGCIQGNHAVVLVGYDDSLGAFKLINQWGATWNGNGYAGLAYSFISNANLALQAFIMTNAVDVPGVQDSPILWSESQVL